MHPHIEKLCSTSRYCPHLKKPKERAGSTGKQVLSSLCQQCGNGARQLPGTMPLPAVFPPCPLLNFPSPASWLLCACRHCSPSHCPHHLVLIMPIALSPSQAHHTVPMACPSSCPSTTHPFPTPPPYANGYKEHLIILVNCLCPPLFPPGDFLTNGV